MIKVILTQRKQRSKKKNHNWGSETGDVLQMCSIIVFIKIDLDLLRKCATCLKGDGIESDDEYYVVWTRTCTVNTHDRWWETEILKWLYSLTKNVIYWVHSMW